jgi:DNA-binding PadR family transcriptional regulator
MVSELREPTYLVLTALADRPLHGYAIIGEVTKITKGQVTLRAGSLYGTLDRLVEEGLVAVSGEEVVDGRLRRYYTLTEKGTASLSAYATRMASVSHEALRRLSLVPASASSPSPSPGFA